MKRLLGAMLAFTLLIPGLSSEAQAQDKPIRLTMTAQYMDRHPIVQRVFKPWIEEIKKRTNGKVIITYYNPNTLCPEGEILDAVIKGQVDIGDHFCARNPGRMPLSTVIGKVPMTVTSSSAGAAAFWDLWNSTPEIQAEYKGMKVLGLHTTASCQVNTKVPVATLEDLKGMRVLGPSKDTMVIINSLGLNGLMQPTVDTYLAMSRNMGDAVMFPIPAMRSYKVNETTKYTMYFNGILGSAWMGMNQAKWDSLPPEVQKVFEETTGEILSIALGKALDDGEKEDREFMEKDGHVFSVIAPEEAARWREKILPALKAAWMVEIEKSAPKDPEAIYARAEEAMRNAEQRLNGNK